MKALVSPSSPVPEDRQPRMPPTAEAVREELGRLLEHHSFRDSPTLQRLLVYVVEETLSGRGRDLKEYALGVSVFKRGNEFDPRTDSIVRVQMGVLRKKLTAFYAGAEATGEVVIEIPRGHYSASFSFRPTRQESVPVPEAVPEKTGWRSLVRRAAWLGAGILIGLAIWLPFRQTPARSAPETAEFPWRDHPLWKGFFEPDSSTQLVVGAPMFVTFGGMHVRDSNINTPDEINRSSNVQSFAKLLRAQPYPDEIYTGLGETVGLYRLGRFFASGKRDLPLVRNRLARWQDIAHSNLLLLSSFRFRTLSEDMDLPRDFEYDLVNSKIRNLRPAKGEALTYAPRMPGGNNDYDYAVVSVWPSPQSGRRIMTLGGAYTWGTQGAAEYVTDPPNLRELAAKLAVDAHLDQHAGVQILLKVLVKDRQPVATSYVTHHWLAKPGNGQSGSRR